MDNKKNHLGTPFPRWIGFLIFLFPAISLTTPSGIGLCSLLFLVTALCVPRTAWRALAAHWPEIRWVVAAFAFQFLLAFFLILLRPEVDLDRLDKPSRMLLAASSMALVLMVRPSRSLLWWGAIVGAVCALPFVAWQRVVLDIERPGGFLNAITFGDIAVCLALLAVCGAIDWRERPRRAWLAIGGALAGMAACLATGTRGSWLGLALAIVPFIAYGRLLPGRRVRMGLGAAMVAVAAMLMVPASGMQERVLQGVDDVRNWANGGNVYTNVGTRLELWKGASILIQDAPLLGRDHAGVRREIAALVEAGSLDPAILSLEHLHNDGLQALATGGVPGLLAWIGMLAAPFAFFARQLRVPSDAAAPDGTPPAQLAPALAGMLMVLCYFGFGMTEVIFWSLKGSMFYALMVFILMGLCLNVKVRSGN